MKILLLLLALAISAPALAAESDNNAQPEKQAETAKNDAKTSGEKKDAVAEPNEKAKPQEFSCPYYSVTMPDDWKAVLPPTSQQGTVNAIFAQNTGTPVVTIIVGQHGGADAKTIAGMFAEQFKAPKQPVEKNGQYTFYFPHQDSTAHACVSVDGKEFMVTTIMGSQKEARSFIRNNVKSAEGYTKLLPQ